MHSFTNTVTCATVLALSASSVHATSLELQWDLLAQDRSSHDQLGNAVAISGNIGLAGAMQDSNENGANAGAVYVFDVTTGEQLSKIIPEDGTSSDKFGNAIALDGDRAVIGAFGRDYNFDLSESGIAYLYDMTDPRNPELIARLLPTMEQHVGWFTDRFGFSVDIDGEHVIVGAPWDQNNGHDSGSAYVFDAGTGQFMAKIVPGDGVQDAEFGFSVGVDDGMAVIGARGDTVAGISHGSAYVYDLSTAQVLRKLAPTHVDPWASEFGYSVTIDQSLIIVGDPSDDAVENAGGRGSAHVFDLTSGELLARLAPRPTTEGGNEASMSSYFGSSLALDNGTAVIGAPMGHYNEQGVVYTYDLTDPANPDANAPILRWNQDEEYNPFYQYDQLGRSVAADGGMILAGAIGHDADGFMNSGAMHVFSLTTNGCSADLDGNGTVDGGDLTMLLVAWGSLGGQADLDGNDFVDGADLLVLLGAWGSCG